MGINEIDFIYITDWSDQHLRNYIDKLIFIYGYKAAFNTIMNFRKSYQKALSKYSERIKKFDDVQMKALRKSEQMVRLLKDHFTKYMIRETLKEYPQLASTPREVKNLVNVRWKRLVKRNGTY